MDSIEKDTMTAEAIEIIDVGLNRVNRLNDRYFKFLFANEKHKPLLIDFINNVMGFEDDKEIVDLEYIANELVQAELGSKMSRLDLSVKLSNGNTADVEVQVKNRYDFRNRSPYYWAVRHSRQLKSGMSYLDIRPTICINILAFSILKDEEGFRNAYSIRNDATGQRLCDDLQIIFLELPKYRRLRQQPRSGLERWLLYLSNEEEENMSRIAEQHPCIAEALLLEHSYWADEKERERYIAEQLYLMDELSAEKTIKAQGIKEGLEQGIEQGIEIGKSEGKLEGIEIGKSEGKLEGIEIGKSEGKLEGIAVGKSEGKLDIAKKMLARGMELDVIADLTGLSIEEVKLLR